MEKTSMKKSSLLKLFSIFTLFSTSSIFSINVKEINNLLDSIEVGNPVYNGNLTVIPIYKNVKNNSYNFVLLEEALEKKYLNITELEGGNVPQVKITNKSDRTIFLMGGEIITGCKQDRIVARDIIISPKKENLIVPVYCIEQGRWSYNSNNFYSKKNLGTYKLRAEAQKSDGEQSKIWNQVSKYVNKNRVKTKSFNYQDIYENKEVKQKIVSIEKNLIKKINLKSNTTGVIIAVGDQVVSIDIFISSYMFVKYWPKILKSSAFTSVNDNNKRGATLKKAVEYIQKLKSKDYTKKEAIDLGEEYSLINKELNVNSIIYKDNVIHLAGFPGEEAISKNNLDCEEFQTIDNLLRSYYGS
jgi:hypothetical protein